MNPIVAGPSGQRMRGLAALIVISMISAGGCAQSGEQWRDGHIRSAGRLPQALHEYALGTPYSELLSAHPDLLAKPNATKRTGILYPPLTASPNWEVSINEGRVVGVNASMLRISPQAADKIRRDIIRSLGYPDSSVQTEAQDTKWAWVDGDVRMLLSSRPEAGDTCPSDAMSVSIQLAYWPLYNTRPDPSRASAFFKRAIDFSNKWSSSVWGGEPLPYSQPKPLPRDHSGLILGMTPEQVRELYPRMKTEASALNDQLNLHLSEELQFLDAQFWRDKLYEISESRNVSPDDFEAVGLKLLAWPFGTPRAIVVGPTVFDATWSDSRTFINKEMMASADSTPTIMTIVRDIRMNRDRQAARCLASPQSYAASPQNDFTAELSGRRRSPNLGDAKVTVVDLSHVDRQYRSILQEWFQRHSEAGGPAMMSGCRFCTDGHLPEGWGSVNTHPYYATGDFNRDGQSDVAIVSKRGDLIIFNGPLNTNMNAAFSATIDINDLLYLKDGVLLVGPWASDNIVELRWDGNRYSLRE